MPSDKASICRMVRSAFTICNTHTAGHTHADLSKPQQLLPAETRLAEACAGVWLYLQLYAHTCTSVSPVQMGCRLELNIGEDGVTAAMTVRMKMVKKAG